MTERKRYEWSDEGCRDRYPLEAEDFDSAMIEAAEEIRANSNGWGGHGVVYYTVHEITDLGGADGIEYQSDLRSDCVDLDDSLSELRTS